MPFGAWRDVLNMMDKSPGWKVSLDIEPESWSVLRQGDPEAFARIHKYLHGSTETSRMEIIGGSYSQPIFWAFSGESMIRQFETGLAVTRESFPDVPINTYAFQEPCVTSALPQILLSFGYKQAVLLNNLTAWGYVAEGPDAEVIK